MDVTQLYFAIALSASPLCAQDFWYECRQHHGYTYEESVSGLIVSENEIGDFSIFPNYSQSQPSTILYNYSNSAAPAVVSAPFSVLGSVAKIGGTRVLVMGLVRHQDESFETILCDYLFQASGNPPTAAIALNGSVAIPGVVGVAMTYSISDHTIYVVDAKARAIIAASWDPAIGPLPAPVSYTTVCDATALPIIGTGEMFDMVANETAFSLSGSSDKSVPAPSEPFKRGFYLRDGSSSRVAKVYQNSAGAAWTLSTQQFVPPRKEAYASFASPNCVAAGPATITVFNDLSGAHHITSLDLVDQVDGGVIQTFSGLPASGGDVVVSMDTALNEDPGRFYILRDQGSVGHQIVRSSVRYGAPIQPTGATISKGYLGIGLFPGNSEYGAGFCLHQSAIPTQTAQAGVLVLVGLRNVDGTIPLDASGILQPVLTDVFFTDTRNDRGMLGYHISIPSDDGLVGTVVLFQFGILMPNGAIGITDIFGETIRPRAYYDLAIGQEMWTSGGASFAASREASRSRSIDSLIRSSARGRAVAWLSERNVSVAPDRRGRAMEILTAIRNARR